MDFINLLLIKFNLYHSKKFNIIINFIIIIIFIIIILIDKKMINFIIN
jgi:hypothetical protein